MNTGNRTRRGRWADHPNRPPSHAANEDDLAMAALLGEATKRSEEQEREQQKQRPDDHRPRTQNQRGDDSNSQYRRSGEKRIVEDDGPNERDSKRGRRRSWNDREEAPPPPDTATSDAAPAAENPNKVKADFGLSGALANDTETGNVLSGVTLKFSEPPEARIPNTRWRLYVFRKKAPDVSSKASDPNKKDDGLIDTYHISRQSAYLFGRERKVADIPIDHTSLSKQHAVLQYRSLPSKQQQIGAPTKLQCKPYLMDLESTNGTFINGVRLDSARYYELRRGDVVTFGASSREYVLLTEKSANTGI
eukprot:CAMPEP_0172300346 /NCGR_PEP_ID=MMETSP1058-20130122/2447_1 /TAXON_ID=83371 /ORGANISM="Detonula confervacea, Strain CCMP 353" /LENGTH=305 /DNA_ID=CAMNT_0013010091 /DNA_START=53 /DNA_END=970 /DNA_ORIENTATION=-